MSSEEEALLGNSLFHLAAHLLVLVPWAPGNLQKGRPTGLSLLIFVPYTENQARLGKVEIKGQARARIFELENILLPERVSVS